MCMHACVYVSACPPVCAYVRECDCLLPGVHVSMIIRNIMQDHKMNTYTTIMFCSVRCLLVGTHAPKIIGKKVTRMDALNV